LFAKANLSSPASVQFRDKVHVFACGAGGRLVEVAITADDSAPGRRETHEAIEGAAIAVDSTPAAIATSVPARIFVVVRDEDGKRLEEEGDSLYHEWLGRLFEGEPDPLTVIKWKEIYDNLEKTLDDIEDASNVLESISIKHA
jgi:hypothetical protein